jgi:hypothetical protein
MIETNRSRTNKQSTVQHKQRHTNDRISYSHNNNNNTLLTNLLRKAKKGNFNFFFDFPFVGCAA